MSTYHHSDDSSVENDRRVLRYPYHDEERRTEIKLAAGVIAAIGLVIFGGYAGSTGMFNSEGARLPEEFFEQQVIALAVADAQTEVAQHMIEDLSARVSVQPIVYGEHILNFL